MEAPASSFPLKERGFLRGRLGTLEAPVAETVVAASGDVAMVIDRDGVICDIALGNDKMAQDGVGAWLDRRWSDTVTSESRHKVDELLSDAARGGRLRWREINQVTPRVDSLMVRYCALGTGHEGQVIAIGRDERATAAMQQRLVEAQQSMERDYSRLRDAEFRYRLLFQTSMEAVVVVDAASRKIIEANPAAEVLIGDARRPLVGLAFTKIFEIGSQEGAAAILTVAQSTAQTNATQAKLLARGRELLVSASLFRQDRVSQCLVRLTSREGNVALPSVSGRRLEVVMERMPDAFIIVDETLRIVATNAAFLDMVRVGNQEQAQGQALNQFLGREGLDRNLLIENLKTHGFVRNFSTILRNVYNEVEAVEVSAVVAPDGAETFFGFTIRRVIRKQSERTQASPELRRSVEQLVELVGQVKLKDLVRETTDLVERLCIEAALQTTNDNRASAAEILGLSRQSLYSKLHRFGLVNAFSTEN